ncbi:hypothetical protein COL154_004694 [Colletotrichum chrysophilum]|nr:uncharacterized protein COL26b_004747 [Colletotrichum chrysophilum]KAF4422912.1 hypothetical protein CFRS1_v001051 [Colletotrichum fructicola]KAI8279531.1 hypothetical protein K4K60_005489 [Colletotrichum sp. SAR11_57]KAJ0351455.1 hypothetical protein KNSL1_003351 [Colletotrichum chrysophilum]KAJ0364886.1 hypothetical protein COL154_004694 [Colletotrichum chrysophilum]KAJ0377078.1 hypothetical protein COL26b_004747 [Colletotrichum chrysophilum]
MKMFAAFRFGNDLWDPSYRFETSWLLSPYLLAACRALISLYIFVTRFFIIGWTCTHAEDGGCTIVGQSFSYFTVLTYWGLAFYFLVSAIHTFTYAHSGSPLLDRFPRPLQALHAFYYTTITTYPFIVTIVYWAIIYSGPWYEEEFNAWSNVSQHAMNSGFALFEIIIPRTSAAQLEWVHMLWLIIVLALYLALAYVTHATQGFYTYDFLDIQKNGSGKTAAYIIGIAVAGIVFYLIVKGLIWLREWVTERKLGMDGKFAQQRFRNYDTELGTINSKH